MVYTLLPQPFVTIDAIPKEVQRVCCLGKSCGATHLVFKWVTAGDDSDPNTRPGVRPAYLRDSNDDEYFHADDLPGLVDQLNNPYRWPLNESDDQPQTLTGLIEKLETSGRTVLLLLSHGVTYPGPVRAVELLGDGLTLVLPERRTSAPSDGLHTVGAALRSGRCALVADVFDYSMPAHPLWLKYGPTGPQLWLTNLMADLRD
jgi:hypothetical protein